MLSAIKRDNLVNKNDRGANYQRQKNMAALSSVVVVPKQHSSLVV